MEKIIDTPCGKIKGYEFNENIIAYKGIRYANIHKNFSSKTPFR